MSKGSFTRRSALRAIALAGGSGIGAAVLAGCGETQVVTQEVVKVVTQQVPVEKVVTKIVKEQVAVEVEKPVEVERVVTQIVEKERIVEKEKIVEKIVTVEAMKPKPSEIKLKWWSFPLGFTPEEVYVPYLRTFQESHPNVDVDFQIFPWKDRSQRMLTAVAAGVAPDIAYFNLGNFASFANLGLLLSLDEYDALQPIPLAEDLTDSANQAVRWGGKIAYAPVLAHVVPPCYNVDLLEQHTPFTADSPPQTRDDFIQAAELMTVDENGNHYGESGFDADNVAVWGVVENLQTFHSKFALDPWFYSEGGEYFSADGSDLVFGDYRPQMEDALGFLHRMWNSVISPADRGAGGASKFPEGRGAIIPQFSPNGIRAFRQDFPDLNFLVGPVPMGSVRRMTHGTVAGYGVFTQSEFPDEAAEFSLWVTNSENGPDFAARVFFATPRKSGAEVLLEKNPEPQFELVMQNMEYPKEEKHPIGATMSGQILPFWQSVVLGEKSPAEAYDEMLAVSETLLKEYEESLPS
ncbi:MAG: extracellular solute-binding protein [Chloroflexi bacterium]|nr:extracellular solute-binding protein [Chloroflexota bacterium]